MCAISDPNLTRLGLHAYGQMKVPTADRVAENRLFAVSIRPPTRMIRDPQQMLEIGVTTWNIKFVPACQFKLMIC